MLNRIDKKFRELQSDNKKAFIAFLMAGDPSLRLTKEIVHEVEKNGADIIELGVPFSDPLADGPTIQRASERALKLKTDIDSTCNMVKEIRLKTNIPIVFLTYYNLVSQYGLEKFVRKASFSGVDGVIIPDLPPEESGDLRRIAEKASFSVIHLVAPTSSRERIKKITKASSGFIYYVSLTGTTGARRKLPKEIRQSLERIKSITRKPICVGFGISTRGQVKSILKAADGVIVGSAIIKIIEQNLGKKNLAKKVGGFVRDLKGE